MRHVVLATAIDREWAVAKHGAAVLHARRMVVFIKLHLVGAGEIVQTLPVGSEGGRQ